MKKIYTIIALLFAVLISNAQTTIETLTNENVIALTKIGLQPSVIITKIKSSKTNFDVSTDALINLNKEGVASEVINEMMKTDVQTKIDIANQTDNKDPNSMHKSGIYYYNKSDTNNPVHKIDAIRVTSFSSSGGGYGGFGGTTTLAHISGIQSRQQVTETSPVFYFYFESNNSRADWYDNASSPNEFVLVKFIEKKTERLFKTGSTSSSGFSSSAKEGVPEKDKIPFDYTEVSDGIYKVTFKNPLPVGEYCFVFATATYKVFDFGIH